MTHAESRWLQSPSRRKALARLAAFVAGSPLAETFLSAQIDPRPLSDHRRLAGFDEMMTAFDFEPVMYANVPLTTYSYTAHGDGSEFTVRRNRQAFDWVDLVPGRAVDPKTVDSRHDRARHEHEVSDPGRPDSAAGARASGR